MNDAAMPVSGSEEWSRVGSRVRASRQEKGMTARELARRVNVSASHVSQVERGLSSFSAAVLYAVASELGISLDSLFDAPVTRTPGEAPTGAVHRGPFEGGIVLRAADRQTIKLRSGPRWERLTARSEIGAEFLEVVYAPRTEELTDSGLTRHEGREYGVILSGALHVEVGFDSTTLYAGDSLSFDSMIPHRFRNADEGETRAIWFVRENVDSARAHGWSPTHDQSWGGISEQHAD